MSNTLKFGNGEWYGKKDTILAYNDENSNFKPLAFNFERNTSATRVNKDGLIETVGSGEPRIDYKDDSKGALLLEPTRSNLITYSEAFDNSYWTKSGSSVTSGFTSPKGDLSAFKLVENTSNSLHYIYSSGISVSAVKNNFSAFVKSAGKTKLAIRESSGTGRYASFDLTNKSVIEQNGTDAKIEELINGWFRISFNDVTTTSTIMGLFLLDDSYTSGSPATSYQGDGTSGVYIFGTQLEIGYATSYIPTSGGAVTRNSDSCLQGGFQDKNIFGSSQGTAVFDIKWDELNYIFDFNVGGVEVIRIYNDNNTQWRIRDTTTSSWYYTGFNITQGQRTKIGFKWSGTEIVAFQNGVKSLNNGLIGSNTSVESITTNKLNNTSNMQFYNTALTDQELINLTTI